MNIKLILYGIAVAALLSLGIYARHVYKKAERVDAAEARVAQLESEAKQKDEQYRKAQKASEDYQNELSMLKVARGPAPVVRLCVQPVVSDSGSAKSRPDGSSSSSGILSQASTGTVGPDIGADLFASADLADEVSARLRALQEKAKSDFPELK